MSRVFRDLSVVALVPARGGSKGIPHKNLSVVGGRSLLERAVSSGLRSRFVDRVVVSTDDDTMAGVAVACGASVHRRSDAAATDLATASDVLEDFVVNRTEDDLPGGTLLVYLQPTSPLRDHTHVDAAFEAMDSRGLTRCVSVVENEHSPHKALLTDSEGFLVPLFDETSVTANRQALPRTYRANGAIYVFPVSDFAETRRFPVAGSLAFEMSPEDSVDIDSPHDLRIAEILLEDRQ